VAKGQQILQTTIVGKLIQCSRCLMFMG